MNEATECLKIYMNNRRIGQHISQEYLDMVNVLIESCVTVQGENTQLKQQLKDKDEKISKAVEYIKAELIKISNCYYAIGSRRLNKILNILESNKEE